MNNPTKLAALLLACLLTQAAAAAGDLVVVGSPSAAPLTKEQVADIFLGKSTAMVPVDLPETTAVRADFYKRATARDQAQVKAVWSRLVFSGKSQPPKEVPDAVAVKKAVTANPKAVGYIEKSAVDATVKVLSTLD